MIVLGVLSLELYHLAFVGWKVTKTRAVQERRPTCLNGSAMKFQTRLWFVLSLSVKNASSFYAMLYECHA